MTRRDATVRCLGQVSARTLDPTPKLEHVIPELARPMAGQVEHARLDLVFHDGASLWACMPSKECIPFLSFCEYGVALWRIQIAHPSNISTSRTFLPPKQLEVCLCL